MVRIPKRGPVVVPLKSGSLDLWYDPNPGCRDWVLQQKDAEGNQVGPAYGGEASRHHSREDAVNELLSILKEDGQ